MKFNCDKNLLLEAVYQASKAVTNKSSIAVLEGLLLEVSDKLYITGYDLNIGIKTSVEIECESEGTLVINCKLLSDILRKLPDDVIYFETTNNSLINIKCGRAVFDIAYSDSAEFPEMPEVIRENLIEINNKTLKSMISETIFAVSDNESKLIHTGCLFETEENQLKVIAVDGYRLAIRKEIMEKEIQNNQSFVVPGFALREIERIVGDDEDYTLVFPNEKHILFETNNTIIITRLLPGTFLNYKAAVPSDNKYEIIISKRDLMTATERVSLIVNERLKNPIKFSFENNLLKLSCITTLGKSYDECLYSGDVDELEIGFNNKYIIDALKACSDEEILITMKSSLTPLVIKPIENDKFLYLVLPVRLKNND